MDRWRGNYGDVAWRMRAQPRGRRRCAGYVFAPVGTATHYHTDWVFPYWSPKLEKLARIETHLFFRWPGFWGSKAAARMGYSGGERTMMSAGNDRFRQRFSGFPSACHSRPQRRAAPHRRSAGGELVMRDPSGKANFVLLGRGSAEAGAGSVAQALHRSRHLPGLGLGRSRGDPSEFPVPPAARASSAIQLFARSGGNRNHAVQLRSLSRPAARALHPARALTSINLSGDQSLPSMARAVHAAGSCRSHCAATRQSCPRSWAP